MTSAADQSGGSLWVETPEVRVGPVARVAIALPIDGFYTFSIPDELVSEVEPGKRLLVPFGKNRRPQPAFCVAVGREPWTSTLKPVADVIDDERLLSDPLLELGQWMARYYFCPLGRTLAAMVPQAIRKQSGFRAVRIVKLAERFRNADCGLRNGGGEASQEGGGKKISAQRQAVIDALQPHADGLAIDVLVAQSGASKGVISAMVKAGLLELSVHREPQPAPDFDLPPHEPTFELNNEQRRAVDRILQLVDERAFRAVLLFGISGSGKTEVYIRAIQSVLARGKQAIMLVPEIALTTQIVERLASRFRNVAVVHSELTGPQRSLTWSAIARGEKQVVIGTRSAVFAPCPNLGVIVVDEEQEGSFKNLQSPRFHTRDVAIKRAQLAACPIVLGSATPSLETWNNCERLSHFERITLPHRVAGLDMPAVEFVDMHLEQRQRKGMHLLSTRLEEELAATLDRNEQAVLLLNRRGYASYLVCSRCRNVVVCPNCRVNMVFHQTTGEAKCHYCQASFILPKRCGDPSCGGTLIRWGMGTQRVEEEIRLRFPNVRMARADSDTMTRISEYERLLQQFESRNLDVLVGTQMIAKGLDFPFVSFVGVVNADTTLAVPDFRAAERTFQLVTQVAGRAGRASGGGRVVVQSLAGQTPALQFAADHDYESFARHELLIRKRFNWPPFTRLARVVVAHHHESEARRTAHELVRKIGDYLSTQALPAEVIGPTTAPLSRLRNEYRYDFLIRTGNASQLLAVLEQLRNNDVLTPYTPNTLVDVDPVALL